MLVRSARSFVIGRDRPSEPGSSPSGRIGHRPGGHPRVVGPR